jgi:hypothetical protein
MTLEEYISPTLAHVSSLTKNKLKGKIPLQHEQGGDGHGGEKVTRSSGRETRDRNREDKV